MIVSNKTEVRAAIREDLDLSETQADRVLDRLEGIVTYEVWETEAPHPVRGGIPKTSFETTDGMPIVHSRKVSNYAVNLRRIFTSSELHETLFDLVEDAISVPRLLYRIARFGVTQSKITLGPVESAVYYLLWKENLCPVGTSEGFEVIGTALQEAFGERLDHARYQASLDALVRDGVIEIREDVIHIVETPWASAKV